MILRSKARFPLPRRASDSHGDRGRGLIETPRSSTRCRNPVSGDAIRPPRSCA